MGHISLLTVDMMVLVTLCNVRVHSSDIINKTREYIASVAYF